MGDSSWDDDDPFADPRPRGYAPSRRNDAPGGLPEIPAVDTGDHRRAPAWLAAAVAAVALFALGGGGVALWGSGGETGTAREADAPVATSPRQPAPAPVEGSARPSSPKGLPSYGEGTGATASALALLEVKGRAASGYDRDLFGQEWADVDRNGCDTRNDVLRRDLDPLEIRPGTQNCVVERGVLDDPFSGQPLNFERGSNTSILVQIDHVVSLSNAWQTGAGRWSDRRREAFANDPLNLLAVDGPLNMQKSDGDAATWLPPDRSYWCDFVSRQVAVKTKYDLWVTPPERDAVARVLARCPGHPLPTG